MQPDIPLARTKSEDVFGFDDYSSQDGRSSSGDDDDEVIFVLSGGYPEYYDSHIALDMPTLNENEATQLQEMSDVNYLERQKKARRNSFVKRIIRKGPGLLTKKVKKGVHGFLKKTVPCFFREKENDERVFEF